MNIPPRRMDPLNAMRDQEGNLLTDLKEINAEALDHYQRVLKNKPMEDPELNVFQVEREKLCLKRLKIAAKNKTPDWKMKDLIKVLIYLKLNKSRDPFGYANQSFK